MDKNYNKIFHQLACPDCNSGDLEEIIESGYLCCKKCNSNFPIIDGNPFLFKRNDLEKHILIDKNPRGKINVNVDNKSSWAIYHWEVYKFNDLIPNIGKKEQELLVYGCGSGHDRHFMEEKGYNVTNIDIKRTEGTDIVCDGQNLPFKNDTFDLVFSSQVLEHLPSPWEGVAEIKRVLKPNGLFVGSVAFMKPFHNSYFHISPAGLCVLLESNDLKLIHIHAAQSVIWSIFTKFFPVRFPTFVRSFLEFAENSYWSARSKIWSFIRKTPQSLPISEYNDIPPLNYEQHHRIKFAPAIVFVSKVK